jgi:broad specificity phosphatase PhoE
VNDRQDRVGGAYEGGIDFSLTPQERDQAALAALHLEDRRRQLNDAKTPAPRPALPPAIQAALAPFIPRELL